MRPQVARLAVYIGQGIMQGQLEIEQSRRGGHDNKQSLECTEGDTLRKPCRLTPGFIHERQNQEKGQGVHSEIQQGMGEDSTVALPPCSQPRGQIGRGGRFPYRSRWS